MDIALIANPGSGGDTDPGELATALSAHGAEVQHFRLDPQGLRRVEQASVERVVVAGGDGSIGPAADVAHKLGVPLALIPTGTANDFARSQQIPLELPRAAAIAIESRRLRRMDLGRLSSGCPFVNVANAGLSTAAAEEAEPLKEVLGPAAYGVGAIRAASGAELLRCRVVVDGREVFDDECWQVLVCVTGAFGGGSDLGPADPQDGRLDVSILPAGSRIGLVRRGWGMRLGRVTEQADVTHHRGCVVELELPPDSQLNVDGELVPAQKPERIVIEPEAFSLVVG